MQHFFLTRPRALLALVVGLGAACLTGCAHDGHYGRTQNSASPQSGITVYGEIDTSVVHTR